MENYSYSSYPEPGDSSPPSREIDCETAVAGVPAAGVWADDLPPPTSRVKLMCSYGGRIQPRHHDNQLAYVGGDTKILAVDRSVRFAAIITKLSALSGADDVVIKYQLPGEDLDSLISVTNDEDLEHMMVEYDQLYRMGLKPVPRLRLFLFTAVGSKGSQDRTVQADPLPATVTALPTVTVSPDYLFGLEAPKLSPIEVPMKDPTLDVEGIASSVAEVMISPKEMQMLEISEKQQQIPKVSSDETLARAYPPEYYAPAIQEKAAVPPPPPPSYWQDQQRSAAQSPPPARFASFVGGDGNLYVFPTSHGVFPANPAYYTSVPRVMHATAYDGAVAYSAAPTQQGKPAVAVHDSMAGYAYDSTGRAVYYAAGTGGTFQAVSSNVAIAAESKVLNPSQVS